jgi:chaperonin GroEL (HSP60 family)
MGRPGGGGARGVEDQRHCRRPHRDRAQTRPDAAAAIARRRRPDIAGDGTSTATVLAHTIVREGAKLVAAGMNTTDLKRGIDLAIAEVVFDLKRRSRKMKTSDEITPVGTTSINGEKMIGDKTAEATQKVGNEEVRA